MDFVDNKIKKAKDFFFKNKKVKFFLQNMLTKRFETNDSQLLIVLNFSDITIIFQLFYYFFDNITISLCCFNNLFDINTFNILINFDNCEFFKFIIQ